MNRLIVIAVLGLVAWQGYAKYESYRAAQVIHAGSGDTDLAARADATTTNQFMCDGRVHCSQMSSCAEATFFLQHCPGVKLDGDNDGVPCEQQFCR